MKKSIIVLLTIAVAMSSCNKKEQKQVKPSVRVETEVISDHAGRAGRSYVGIVEEREGTAVSFTGMGVVKRVFVNEGQPVRRGQLIAEMDDTQARNLLSGAEASMTQANDALERMKMLHDNGSLPEMQWVEVQSRVAQARSQLAVARRDSFALAGGGDNPRHQQREGESVRSGNRNQLHHSFDSLNNKG